MPLEDINARQMLKEAVDMLDELGHTGPRPKTDRIDMSDIVSALQDLPESGPEFIRADSVSDLEASELRPAAPAAV